LHDLDVKRRSYTTTNTCSPGVTTRTVRLSNLSSPIEIQCVAKGYQECPFVVHEGEEIVAQRKHGTRGKAFKGTNARGQLGHLERVLVAPLWPLREEIKW